MTDEVIYMGDLVPEQNVVIPIWVEVLAGTRVQTQISGCILVPSEFAESGKQLLNIGLRYDKLKAGNLVTGQIVLQNGANEEALWLVGSVLETPPDPAVHHHICLKTDSGAAFFCNEFLKFNAQTLGVFMPGADQVIGDHTLLVTKATELETPEYFALMVPDTPPPNSTLNRHPLTRWSRTLLRNGQLLMINGKRFRVDASSTPSVELDRHVLSFGKLSQSAGAIDVTIRKTKGRTLDVHLLPNQDWIEVSHSNFQLNGQETFQVRLNAGVGQLPKGLLIEHSAIWVLVNQAEIIPLSVVIDVDQMPVIPSIDTNIINFGKLYLGQAADQEVSFTLQNEGESPWEAHIDPGATWLQAEPSGPFTIPPHSQQLCKLITTSEANQLPLGAPPNITMVVQGNASITARVVMNVVPVPIKLHLQPAQVDFGIHYRQSSTKSQTLLIRNDNDSAFQCQVRALVPWITVSPTSLHLESGESAHLNVQLTNTVEQQPDGVIHSTEALQLEFQYGSTAIPARVQLLPGQARLVASVSTLVFPPIRANDPLPTVNVEIHNEGDGPWQGPIHPRVDWIDVQPRQGQLNPGETMTLQGTLKPNIYQFDPGPQNTGRAIQVVGSGQSINIGASVNILPPTSPPQPVAAQAPPQRPPQRTPQQPPPSPASPMGQQIMATVNPTQLDFGKLQPGINRTLNIHISVRGGSWRGQATSQVPWLTLRPFSFAISDGSEREVAVTLESRQFQPQPGSDVYNDAIIIEGDNGQRISIAVRVASGTSNSIFGF